MTVTSSEGTTLTKEKEKKLKAKSLSKMFKVVSVLGLITCGILKWLNVLPKASIGEICALWATVYGLGAGTIDANIIIDKFISKE